MKVVLVSFFLTAVFVSSLQAAPQSKQEPRYEDTDVKSHSKIVPALMYYIGADNCVITEGTIMDCDGTHRSITTEDYARIDILKNEMAPERSIKKSINQIKNSVFASICKACAKLL